jgi:OTU domain-containing protein 6
MSLNDKKVLNAILNPNTPFQDENSDQLAAPSKYEINDAIIEAKKLECQEKLESLQEKHKQQRKELQSQIQSLKKSVTKGDKKKKKEIDTQIEGLEREFEEKCQTSLKDFEASTQSEPVQESTTKVSKSAKRKEKKEKSDQQRDTLIAQQEIENLKGPAFLELTKINERLKVKRLKIKEVHSDGNCMYYAIADQLNSKQTCAQLRQLTCDYMLKHACEFQPYLLCENDESDIDFTDEAKYEDYCFRIRDTLVWGSQIELKALSAACNVLIEVVQAEGPEIVIGGGDDDYDQTKEKTKLIITFHRHMLSSSHYNSTEEDESHLET